MASLAQGGIPSAPKPQVGPPEPVLAPKWPKTTSGPPMASGNHQRPPAQLQEKIPLSFRGRIFLSQYTPYSRIQEWCIYGIIYHYAPFFLSNPIVTFSGPDYMIPNQVPNPSPILKKGSFSYFSLAIPWWLPEDHSTIPTTLPCRGWAVIFSSGIF
ncbi:hypothetical protein O181_075807 [Austropuccinia psidii MF-1]|uniref:Uncharacterized protein n=1 Tax=Austropuccinia psidii MF-1 TaxID=1389203 RepID=A0A9Q3FD91_9BASI|nr:hypothetical protein [Austropuccinia psidii MF-1]